MVENEKAQGIGMDKGMAIIIRMGRVIIRMVVDTMVIVVEVV